MLNFITKTAGDTNSSKQQKPTFREFSQWLNLVRVLNSGGGLLVNAGWLIRMSSDVFQPRFTIALLLKAQFVDLGFW